MDKATEQELKDYEKDKQRFAMELEMEKQRFIQKMKSGLGHEINDYRTYVKPEPGIWRRIATTIDKIFRKI